MVSFTTAATVSLVAFASLIEPSIQGLGIASSIARSVGSSVLGSVASEAISGKNPNSRRDLTDLAPELKAVGGNTALAQLFDHCVEALDGPQGSKTAILLNKVTKGAKLTDVPQPCIDAVTAFNSQWNITEIEKTQGHIKVVNGTILLLSGVEGPVQKMLENVETPAVGAAAGAQ